MKRHIMLAALRGLLAVGVLMALPVSHLKWGQPYPGDGQQAFGFIVIFFGIGLGAAFLFFVLGSLAQFVLRKRLARCTMFADLALFLLFVGILIYGGVTAKYQDTMQKSGVTEPVFPLLS